MYEKPRSFLAAGTSLVIHAAFIVLLFSLTGGGTLSRNHPTERLWQVTRLVEPLWSGAHADRDPGGGSGGRAKLRASFGDRPRVSDVQFVPPIPAATNVVHILTIEPSIAGPSDLILPHVPAPDWGDPSALPGPPSAGLGCCDGVGDGKGASVGPGQGPRWGSGTGGYGPRVWRVGQTGVSAPIPVYQVEPEYSEEARKAKFQGTVVLEIVIDERGYPTNFRFLQPLGLGLDEKAVEAVKKWRFRPGMKNGKPVGVVARIEVNFRLL